MKYAQALALKPTLKRLDQAGARWYTDEVNNYLSVSSFSDEMLPRGQTGDAAKQFVAARDGADAQKARWAWLAARGTVVHIILADITLGHSYKYGQLVDKIDETFTKERVHVYDYQELQDFIYKQALSWIAFLQEKKPILLAEPELQIASQKLGLAGTIDYLFEINKEICIADVKTSSAFYDSHAFQLECYKEILSEYLDIPIEKIKTFNWRAKDWRTTPTYELKDQTINMYNNKIHSFARLARDLGVLTPPKAQPLNRSLELSLDTDLTIIKKG